MKCINCDKKIKSSDTYCSNCGINLKKHTYIFII